MMLFGCTRAIFELKGDNVNGDLQFHTQPPPHTKSIPLNRSTENSARLITSARGRPIRNLVEIHPLEASGKMGEI